MDKTEEKQIMDKAIEKFGVHAQEDVAMEEMSELIKAILKVRRTQDKEQHLERTKDVIEEIADCEVMLDQLKIIFDCHEEVVNMKDHKLKVLRSKL